MLDRALRWVAEQVRAALRTPVRLLAAIAVLAVTFGVGLVVGNWASDQQLKDKILARLSGASASPISGTLARRTIAWRRLNTHLHDLQTATIPLGRFETHGRGGALDEIDGGIVFASPVGRFGYLTRDYQIQNLDLEAPLNAEGLAQSPVSATPGFLQMMFRVLDILTVERAPGQFDLYVSHHRFADECFELVVSRTRLEVADGQVTAASPDWEDEFVAAPCLPLKTQGMPFEGNESGGRMVLRDPDTLLLALGDLQFNGVDDPRALSQDPDADFGKIVEIDIATGASRHVASGVRNPQGLLIARDGVIWETEHGPQGGDEVNVIREGANYGWPEVTYGVNYAFGGARRPWPANPEQGAHEGFEKPVYAFVPSISISNIIQPDPREFPLWRDSLIIASLYAARSLYLARVEGNARFVTVEQVPVDAVVRDIIQMRDGRIALLTDAGEIVMIRNAEPSGLRERESDEPLVVTASDDVVALAASATSPMTDAQGEELFTFTCSACHSMTGDPSVGPPLNGVVGRRVGGVPGYPYSAALADHDGQWTRRRLVGFLLDQTTEFSGTRMAQPTLSQQQIESIVDFLATE